MKPALPMLLAVLALAAPAAAQNAGQVDRARSGASCPHCNLFQADFSNKRMTGRNFAGSRLRQADFSAAEMNHTVFAGADLRDVNAYGGLFSSSVFSGAEMSHARGLTQHQLDAACGDEATTLPRGLRIPRCR